MKPLVDFLDRIVDRSSVRLHTVRLFGIALLVAVAITLVFGSISFLRFLDFAMPFALAGIAVFIAAALLSAARKKALQQQRRFARIRRRS